MSAGRGFVRGVRFAARGAIAAVLVGAVVMLGMTPAFADIVSNTVVAGGSPTVRVGETTSIGYTILNQNNNAGDPQNNCNPRRLHSGDADCEQAGGGDGVTGVADIHVVWHHPVLRLLRHRPRLLLHLGVGDGCRRRHLRDQWCDVHVDGEPPLVVNTAPVVKISGVISGTSYEFGNVPVARCNVTDKEDGNSSFDASLSAITGPRAGRVWAARPRGATTTTTATRA